ncbi:MAG: methyltransferase domain-containing protein [Myxococcota bacterium]
MNEVKQHLSSGLIGWWNHRTVRSHLNQQICGEALPCLGDGLTRCAIGRLDESGPLERGLSVGKTHGYRERRLINLGLVASFDIYCPTQSDANRGRQLALESKLDRELRFFVGGLESIPGAPEAYDLIHWANSLHRLDDVSEAIRWSHRQLRPGGMLLLDEYVGPDCFQWSNESLRLASRVRASLESRFLRDPSDESGETLRPIQIARNPDLVTPKASSEIIPATLFSFPDAKVFRLGGLIYHLALSDIISNFDPLNSQHNSLIRTLMVLDQGIVQSSSSGDLYGAAVATKQHTQRRSLSRVAGRAFQVSARRLRDVSHRVSRRIGNREWASDMPPFVLPKVNDDDRSSPIDVPVLEDRELPSQRAIRTRRREVLERHKVPSQSSILEIGAFDQPTYSSSEAQIEFMDYFETEDLKRVASRQPARDPERIVPITYLCKEKRFSCAVNKNFDAVIAHHVIEHVPDMLSWFSELEQLLKPNGVILLSIPDRRFTFDYLRAETDPVEFVRCQDEDLDRPTVWHVMRELFLTRPIRSADVWQGRLDDKLKKNRFSLSEAEHRAHDAVLRDPDVHCHVFSFPTFARLLDDLIDAHRVSLRLIELVDVQCGGNEFHAVLKKSAD